MNRPFVTYIVPLYQSAATIAETLASIQQDLTESGVDGEIIVVNDGSRDTGPDTVRRVAAGDTRLFLVDQSNKGLAAARNAGLERSFCKQPGAQHWVRFLDADDLAVPGSTRKLLLVAARLGTGAACGGHELIDEAGESLGRTAPAGAGPNGTVGLEELLGGNRMGVGTALIRRDLIGPMRFDERLRVCEDWDLWLRLAQNGVRFAATPAWSGPMKSYRVRRGSLSKDYSTMLRVGTQVLHAAFSRLCRAGDAKLQTAIRGQALAFAGMQAVSDAPEAVDRAMALLPSLQGLASEAVAEALLWGILLGRGERPDPIGDQPWRTNMTSWLKLASPSTDDALRARVTENLARLAVSPDAIAETCVRAAADAGATSIAIIGLGLNGMQLVRACRSAGVSFTVRDDRLTHADAPGLADQLAAHVVPSDASIRSDEFVIVSPERDQALAERLKPMVSAGRLIRWSEAQVSLAKSEWARPKIAARQPVTV